MRTPHFAICCTMAAFASAASADGVIHTDFKFVDAITEARQGGDSVSDIDSDVDDLTGLDWSGSVSAATSLNGSDQTAATALAMAYLPSDPGIGGLFRGINLASSSSARAESAGGNEFESAFSGYQFDFVFSVDESTPCSFTARFLGSTIGAVYTDISVELRHGHDLIFGQYSYSVGDGDSFDDPAAWSGILGPGTYSFVIGSTVEAGGVFWEGGEGWTAVENGVFMIPSPSVTLPALLAAGLARRRCSPGNAC